MRKGILVGGGEEGGDTGDMFWQNFVTSQELMVACRNGPFLLLCSVCFSQFRARDGTLENCSFQMSSVHVHARAYVCIIKEMSKGKFPDLGKQSIQAKKVYRLFFFWRAILKCRNESYTLKTKSES